MTELVAGDKVKFLNQKGGGVVVRVIDPKMVMVSDDDGFEFPVLVTELVKLDPTNAGGRFFEEHFRSAGKSDAKQPGEDADYRVSEIPPDPGPAKPEEIYLAFIPHDQKWLMTGPMDVMIINNTGYDLLYNLFHRTATGHYEGVDYGSVFAGSRLLLATVNRENLARWSDGYLQFLFHKSQTPSVLPPFNSEFRVEGKKFFKEGNYRESAMAGGKAIVIRILSLEPYLAAKKTRSEGNTPENVAEISNKPLIFNYQTAPREAEIDLHIHELLEDPSNMEKGEILEYQKEFFLKCLDSAIAAGFLKVTVIHGVGNGVLRNAVLGLIKNYGGIEVIDAPMAKYGVGAVELRIPHNRG